MQLAKPALDVGLYTEAAVVDASLSFWQDEVGLAYEELLKVGGGVHQHRLRLDQFGGVLKLNASREPLAEAPGGLRMLTIAGANPRTLQSPEGVNLTIAESGPTSIVMAVTDIDPARRWWIDGLGAADIGNSRVQLGNTVVLLLEEPNRLRTGPQRARGFRYLTVQIRDVRAEHARLLELGTP